MEALNVFPNTWRPTECLESLKIRNTRTSLMILNTEKETEELLSCDVAECEALDLKK